MNGEKGRLFEETALPCLDALYGFGLLLTGRPDEAEDLVQETFLRAYRFFHQYEHGTNCKAWLFTIMKHIFLNQSTQKARMVLCRDVLPDEEGESQSLWDAMGRSPASSLRDEVFSKDIEKALALLPETFRLVVILKDVEGFSYGEIAQLVDCPIGTVMSRLSRARDMLRRFLRDYSVQSSGSHGLKPTNLTRRLV
ncbi:MAG TPA: sigma-70 family RNA polymerase sigma factor [Nitrospirales bacterium]